MAETIRKAADFDSVAHLSPELLNLVRPEWIEARCATFSRDQLLAAFRQASLIEDTRLRDMILRACLHHLPPAESWELLAHCPQHIQFRLSRDIAVKYGPDHGGSAVDVILHSRGLVQPLIQARDAFESWAEKRPEEAAEWLGNKMKDDGDPLSYQLVREALQETHPAAAPALLKQVVEAIGRGDHRYDQSISDLAYRWALGDAEHALAWAESVQGDVLRERMLSGVGLGAANVGGDAIALRVADSMGSYRFREHIYAELAKSKADRDPASARTWAASIQNPLLRAKVSAVIEAFMKGGDK